MPHDHQDGARHFLKSFQDPEAVATYTEGPRRFVPGLDALHVMTGLLLAERAPADGRILALGAGGGAELKALATAYPGWRFVGVDPAGPMLDLAASNLGAMAERAELIEGYIDDSPEGPFDGATSLLTLHFLDHAERLRTVREIRRRLKPGSRFVAAHGSYPQGDAAERDVWLDRYASFAIASGGDPDQIAQARAAVAAAVNMIPPEEDEDILRAVGFTEVSLFFTAFTWRGWVATA